MKKYQDLEIKILLLQQEDIVTTSPNGFDDVSDDPFEQDGGDYFG